MIVDSQYIFTGKLVTIPKSWENNLINYSILTMNILKIRLLFQTYPTWANEKNIILSSFFWGYVCFQVVAGQVSKRYGAKYVLLGAIFITSLFSILIPVFGSTFGYGGVIACRIIQGCTQGFLFPSIHTLLSLWTPLSERVKWGGMVYAGKSFSEVRYSWSGFTGG